jgi:hypothetical protein
MQLIILALILLAALSVYFVYWYSHKHRDDTVDDLMSLIYIKQILLDEKHITDKELVHAEMLSIADQAISLMGDDPNKWEPFGVKGDILIGRGQKEEARRCFNKALSVIQKVRSGLSGFEKKSAHADELFLKAKLEMLDKNIEWRDTKDVIGYIRKNILPRMRGAVSNNSRNK